ncbi:tetratricopeptide repeat protein [Acinetobacter soli]|uniref:tetratricopeptide repeat protein n=1 Tax=Acinetobacter soli TaxID=487316 RepID=UPI000468ABA1|nr:tetratricopeptide repeat protein [Acinetobacter soli]
MLMRKLSFAIILMIPVSSIYAHPKHHHSYSGNTEKNQHAKATYSDATRNQIVNVLLENAYAKGDGDSLEKAEQLMQKSNDPSDLENQLLNTRIEQANHNFSAAEQRLKQLLKTQPSNSDAILQLANIYRLQGKYSASTQLCQQLTQPEVMLYRAGCELQVDAMTKSYSQLKPQIDQLLSQTPRMSRADQQWLGNIFIELATRFNDPALADKSMLLLQTNNLPNTLAKANWYIAQHQYQTALKLLTPYRYHDGAMYRIILCKQKLNDPSAQADLNELTQRVQDLLDHHDHIHLREQAQFLWISKKYNEGLKIAAKNWDMQRENDDFEVYAALAIAAKDTDISKKLLTWSEKTGYQHPEYIPQLQQIVNQS